jgi:uncharacterized damage-inducible protein DinB
MTAQSHENPVLVAMFEHHTWSNLQIIDFCAGLTDEQLALTAPGVFGSVIDMIKHLYANESHYLGFLEGCDSVAGFAQRGPFPGWNTIRTVAEQSGNELIAFAASLEGDPIQRGMDRGEPFAIATSVFIVQIVNHATEHRSHIRSVLSINGVTPPEIDGWTWLETLPKQD